MKKQKQGVKFPLSYYKRLSLNFERIIIKETNRQLVDEMRQELNIKTKKWSPMTGEILKRFSEFATEGVFKKLVDPKIFYLLNKMNLEYYYFRPMLLHLYSGEMPKRIWFCNTGIAFIEGQSVCQSKNAMIDLANYHDDRNYPVKLQIAVHASQDEVCEFVRNNWGEIKRQQKEFGKKYLRNIKDVDFYLEVDKLKKLGDSYSGIMKKMKSDPRIKKLDTNDDLAKKMGKGRKFIK